MAERVQLYLRLPATLHQRIKALAERERRSLNSEVVYLLETHPEVQEAMTMTETTWVERWARRQIDRHQAETEAWEGYVGRQTPGEFVQYFMDEGVTDIDEMARRYVADIPTMLDVEAADLPDDLADLLSGYIQRHVATCELCSAAGQVTVAMERVLGRDACDQCAAELEGSLQIGPAIWLVEVRNPWPHTDPVPDDPDADYGTIDYGDFTLGYRDRAAAERYAAQVGAGVREGFLVEIIGDSEADALDAAEVESVGFDAATGVIWPHDDEEGLRRRLLYGAGA